MPKAAFPPKAVACLPFLEDRLWGARLHRAGTGGFALIKADFCRRCLSHSIPVPLMLARVGVRSRAINIRISWNICRGTATLAIWKVTYRPWLTTRRTTPKNPTIPPLCATSRH